MCSPGGSDGLPPGQGSFPLLQCGVPLGFFAASRTSFPLPRIGFPAYLSPFCFPISVPKHFSLIASIPSRSPSLQSFRFGLCPCRFLLWVDNISCPPFSRECRHCLVRSTSHPWFPGSFVQAGPCNVFVLRISFFFFFFQFMDSFLQMSLHFFLLSAQCGPWGLPF